VNQSSQYVLSGLRPTGRVHLGNYFGAVKNWVELQDRYPCFFFVADWHALTSDYADPSNVHQSTFDAVADWLSAGLDPARCGIFLQSEVKAHAELHLLLSMVTPLPWLERVPTFKDQQQQLEEKDLNTYGFLGYPLLQTADIIVYRAGWVPVGEDQASHLELSREIVRRFNNFYGPVFPEPQPLFTATPKVPGLDGRKMSKSYGNAIYLSDTTEEITAKVKPMVTDPARKRRSDPGNPDICPVFDLHRIFTPEGPREQCATGCRTAAIGCLDCKGVLLQHMLPPLAQIRERRQRYVDKPAEIVEILHEGSKRARKIAVATMTEVRDAIKLEP
jgi:tryptophanyl-tRNA synthetase